MTQHQTKIFIKSPCWTKYFFEITIKKYHRCQRFEVVVNHKKNENYQTAINKLKTKFPNLPYRYKRQIESEIIIDKVFHLMD